MIGLLSSPLALMLAAAIAVGGVQTWRLDREQTKVAQRDATIAQRDATIAQRDATIVEQNASIGLYKQQSINQAERTNEANSAAKKAGQVWAKRLEMEKAVRPPPATDYAGPLQMCLGTVEWMRSQYNRLAEEWNNAQ